MVLMIYRVLFVVIQREDEEEYNQEYKNKRPSVDALEIKGGKS